MEYNSRKSTEEIRSMSSDEAASWLMKKYPITDINYGDVFPLIKSRSWTKNDHIRLARYYLQRIPFSNSRPYEIFLSLLPTRVFISIIKDYLPNNPDDISLFIYQMRPVINKEIKNEKNTEIIELFLRDLTNISNNSL